MEWPEYLWLLVMFVLGGQFGRWDLRRKQNKYKFTCSVCHSRGKHFMCASNSAQATARMADGHMKDFHSV